MKQTPSTNPSIDSCPFHNLVDSDTSSESLPSTPNQTRKTATCRYPCALMAVTDSASLEILKLGWGFVGEVRLHTPLKENITNTNRWMFKPLRVMYSKAIGKPWRLWDEGPQLIQCDDLLGSPPSHSGKGRFSLGIPNKKLIKILVVDIALRFCGMRFTQLQPINQPVPFVTPWRRIFILEKKGLQIEETEEICLSNWLISAKTMWRFKTTKFKWIKSSPIEITFKLMLSGTRVVDGFNPFENYKSNGIISSGRGEIKQLWNHHLQKDVGKFRFFKWMARFGDFQTFVKISFIQPSNWNPTNHPLVVAIGRDIYEGIKLAIFGGYSYIFIGGSRCLGHRTCPSHAP